MQTIVLEMPGKFRLTNTIAPAAPGAGEAVVRVRRIGVCGTDLHAFRGRQPFFTYPRVLGHELGVEVEAVGPGVTNVAPGDRCCVEPYLNCGTCIACRRGKTNCCTRLQTLGVHTDGGMRERIVLPANKLYPSKTLTLDQLALVETLGIGAHAVSRASLEPDEFALVVGAGPIGLSVVQFARAAGARVIVMDVSESRLEFCRRQLGVEHSVVAKPDVDPVEALKKLTNDDLPTAVFDATGNPQSMMSAFRYVAPGGRIVFVGLFQGDVTFNDPEFHRREVTLLASRNATPADFRHILTLMESGRVDTTPWITHRAPFADVPARFAGWLEPGAGVIKAMVEM
jgi:2-desacetyl-2-hydroxyethyl bacteriochlorophyllide A dehydrogenase